MFDGRINLTSLGSGNDPGYFNDPEINKEMDAAAAILDPVAREKAWGDISEKIADEGGYVGLNAYKFYSLYGSGVKNVTVNRSGSVDLAAIAVR
jgi:peptide/nickel transport system substrate-binding protein